MRKLYHTGFKKSRKDLSMPKIIVTSRYIKPNAHKKFGNYIKYIATREGVEKPVQKQDSNKQLEIGRAHV